MAVVSGDYKSFVAQFKVPSSEHPFAFPFALAPLFSASPVGPRSVRPWKDSATLTDVGAVFAPGLADGANGGRKTGDHWVPKDPT